MPTYEGPSETRRAYERQEAEDFCDEFVRVLEEFKKSTSDMDKELAAEAAGLLVSRQLFGWRFRFLAEVPEGVRAETSRDWDVIQEGVRKFEGTKLEHMGYGKDGFQVDFLNEEAEKTSTEDVPPWLSVYECYDIKMTPVFPE